MAYQARKVKSVVEEFELVEKGRVVEHFLVELDAGSVISKLMDKHVALVRAQQDVRGINQQSSSPEEVSAAYEKLGNAVVDIIECVFGAEDTKKIIDFYENRYVDMIQEVIPFITRIVIPRVRTVAKQLKKDVLSGYNRKQRRSILKGMRG